MSDKMLHDIIRDIASSSLRAVFVWEPGTGTRERL